jgi:hypothetical protein
VRKLLTWLVIGGFFAMGCNNPTTPTKPPVTNPRPSSTTSPKEKMDSTTTPKEKMDSATPPKTETPPSPPPKENKPGDKKDDNKQP